MEGLGTFALGVAAALVAQAGGPSLARRARPVVRGAIKQAILLGEGVRARTEGLREDLADLAAEARVEARQQQAQQAGQAQQAQQARAPRGGAGS